MPYCLLPHCPRQIQMGPHQCGNTKKKPFLLLEFSTQNPKGERVKKGKKKKKTAAAAYFHVLNLYLWNNIEAMPRANPRAVNIELRLQKNSSMENPE